jgi:dTDP-4-dehydrorhamnose 3,5-epimerase
LISGVEVTPLQQIHDERGAVMHMLREDSRVFQRFGEVYFSTVFPGVVKAWHQHKEMTLNYAVVAGEVKLVLFDERVESSTYGKVEEYFLSPQNYLLITVPPGVWNGFKGIGVSTAIVANCSTLPHSPDEILRKPADSEDIPYQWQLENR